MSECNNEIFHSYDFVLNDLKEKLGDLFKQELLDLFICKSLITSFECNNQRYLYKTDVDICEYLMTLNADLARDDYVFVGYNGDMFVDFLKIGEGTYLRYPIFEREKEVPAFVKNILYLFRNQYEEDKECQYDLLGVSIITNNRHIIKYISNVIYRKYCLDKIKSSNFANSSAYMGSKKSLMGFIIEAIWPHLQGEMSILDIMCGSGAASNAFSQMGKVYASDAQYFCRLLAKVQGSGFSVIQAEKFYKYLYKSYKEHMCLLKSECADALMKEQTIFHMDMRNRSAVLEKYLEFIRSFDLYSTTDGVSEEISRKILERKSDHKKMPYCLFTYYFSNIYFGLEQCNQIDSIRYAIDQIDDADSKEWLLGILIISVSSVASNYAGHFAQPKKLDESSLYGMIETRKRSVWLEFSKRLFAIAEESERYSYEIVPIEGPWENAVKQIKTKEENFLVYLDAPYTREEYSRYYHVLETLALYDYPASEKKGRLRSLHDGERFKSEFSSRNNKKVEDYLTHIIQNILMISSVCAWSYSSNGSANIINVINKVAKLVNCNIYIHSISHRHASQGKYAKQNNRVVIEYCIVFVRQEKSNN